MVDATEAESLYDDPLLYEEAFRSQTEDIDFYCRLARAQAHRVLEYGCGAGRVTLPLARQGTQVVGVDSSDSMLALFRSRLLVEPPEVRGNVQLRKGDMRRLRFRETFELLIATFNVPAHLLRLRDMQAWLRRAKAALAPQGELVFDVALPAAEEVEADPEERVPLPAFRHPRTGQWICHDERFEYDPKAQVLLVESDHWARGRPDRLTTRVRLRQWFPKEVESLLRYEGFSVDLRADYTDQPVALCQHTLIVRAKVR